MATLSSEYDLDYLVTDDHLKEILAACARAREQCIAFLDQVEAQPINEGGKLSEDAQKAISKQQRLLNSYLAQLRAYNRDSILRVRNTKQVTAEARQEVDRLHLQLQNLYYEEMHLSGEITACESYDHTYQQLPLLSEQEFLELQPGHGNDDEKALMFARIDHELAEREILEQERQSLLKQKSALVAENKKRRDGLASLDQDLEKFIDAAKPIQQIFEKHFAPTSAPIVGGEI